MDGRIPRIQNAHHIQPGEPVHEPSSRVALLFPQPRRARDIFVTQTTTTRSKSDESGSGLLADSAVVVSRLQLQQQEHVAIMQRHERTEQSRKQMQTQGLPDYGKMTYLQLHLVRVVACILVWVGGATIEI